MSDIPKPSPLRDRRLSFGLSQTDLALAAGLSQQTVSELETGRWLPRWGSVCVLEKALGCTPWDVFSANNDDDPEANRAAVTKGAGDVRHAATG